MKLEEAIKIFNERCNDNYIKQYENARSVILEEMSKRKPEEEYYKSSDIFDYYFELPYEEICITYNGIEFKKHYFNGIAKKKGGSDWVINHCLSLCNYSKEEIQKLLDSDIEKDKVEG